MRRVRAATERLASVLSAEDQTVQTMPDVSPTKWHRAHVTWFFETFILGEYAPEYQAFNEAYAYIFNSYYEAVARDIRGPSEVSSPVPASQTSDATGLTWTRRWTHAASPRSAGPGRPDHPRPPS